MVATNYWKLVSPRRHLNHYKQHNSLVDGLSQKKSSIRQESVGVPGAQVLLPCPRHTQRIHSQFIQ
jgi:hypothetical protein